LGLDGGSEAARSGSGHEDLHLVGDLALVRFLGGFFVQNLPDLAILERDLWSMKTLVIANCNSF
jgi:hypothetical protein